MSETAEAPANTQGGMFFFQRRFMPMWLGQCLGAITDNALKQALIIGLTFKVFTFGDMNGDDLFAFFGCLVRYWDDDFFTLWWSVCG